MKAIGLHVSRGHTPQTLIRTMSTASLERDSQPPTNTPKIPTTQLVVSQANLLHSTPLNHGTLNQESQATSPLYARTTLRAAIEMLLMSRAYVWKILIIGLCLRFGPGSLF